MKLSIFAASIALIAKSVTCAPVDITKDVVTKTENGNTLYYWNIDKEELKNIRDVFDDDKEEIKLTGTWVTAPQRNCHNCGKKETFLDSVYTADVDNIHTKQFMKRALIENDRENKAPERFVKCSNCNTNSLVKRGWAVGTGFNWTHNGVCTK
jgi:hypothetical protein